MENDAENPGLIFKELIRLRQPREILQWLGMHQFQFPPTGAANVTVLSGMGDFDNPLPLAVINYLVLNSATVADSRDLFSLEDRPPLPRPASEGFLLEVEAP